MFGMEQTSTCQYGKLFSLGHVSPETIISWKGRVILLSSYNHLSKVFILRKWVLRVFKFTNNHQSKNCIKPRTLTLRPVA